jgi:hypothetical protein
MVPVKLAQPHGMPGETNQSNYDTPCRVTRRHAGIYCRHPQALLGSPTKLHFVRNTVGTESTEGPRSLRTHLWRTLWISCRERPRERVGRRRDVSGERVGTTSLE